MEPCVRGFSYMPPQKDIPENKVEVIDLQYIEGGELERTWKMNRRQRLKDQEQKIWEEFVKEQDVVQKALEEDPYQFLQELPQNCLQELMVAELQKIKKSTYQDPIIEQPNRGEGDPPLEQQGMHMVTYAEEPDQASCNMFQIFDDEVDINEDLSGPEPEDENVDSPSTVREMHSENSVLPSSTDKGSVKPENVTSLIESSIYCARVKDIRLKINEELNAIMNSLECQNVMAMEQEDIGRKYSRSTEFCNRYNRIYLYQLQRQMHDIERGVSRALPFGQHTQFQSQMLRLVSLHQNTLQAIQVFIKSFPSPLCLHGACGALRGVARAVRAASALARAVPAPRDLAAAAVYSDELGATCDRLDEAVGRYEARAADFLRTCDDVPVTNMSTPSMSSSRNRSKAKNKGRADGTWKSCSSKDSDRRLSMYSLDTLRINIKNKSTNSRDNQSSKLHNARAPLSAADKAAGLRLSPGSRRPLMRAPGAGRARARAQRDAEVSTMVELLPTCPSMNVSSEMSPHSPRKSPTKIPTLRPDRFLSPLARAPRPSPRDTSPLRTSSPLVSSPLTASPRAEPKPARRKTIISTNKSEAQTSNSNTMSLHITPVTKIHTSKKEKYVNKDEKDPRRGKEYDNDVHRSSGEGRCAGNLETPRDDHPKSNLHVTKATAVPSKGSPKVKDIGCNEKEGHQFDPHPNMGKQHGHIGNPGKEDTYTGQECSNNARDTESSAPDKNLLKCFGKGDKNDARSDRESNKSLNMAPARCEVTRLLRQLRSGDASGSRVEGVTGAKNAQLLCISSSFMQPNTPQLLRILEETIQKKSPRPMYRKDPERYRLTFNIAEKTADQIFKYRTKFVQHMLTSPMYANSAVGKPWEMIGSVSEKIIDEVLMNCVKEMEIKDVIQELYKSETN